MLERLLNDDIWFQVVTPFTVLVVILFLAVARRRRISARASAVGALNLFFGLWIAIMGSGHLFGVTTKTVLGILPSHIRLWVAIPFGFAMAVPGWWLAWRVRRVAQGDPRARKEALWLNAWLVAILLVPAAPLVVPPLINMIAMLWLGKRIQQPALPAAAG